MEKTETYYDRQLNKDRREGEPSHEEVIAKAREITRANLAASMGLDADDPRVQSMVDLASGFGEQISQESDAELTEQAKFIFAIINPNRDWGSADLEEQDRYREAVDRFLDRLDELPE